MANKLAGQRAKFSRARAIFYSTSDDAQRHRAAQLMAEVLTEAPANGFSEDEVTQGEDVPDDVRQLSARLPKGGRGVEEDPDALVAALQATVDTADVLEIGQGDEFVYAYGYRCAPDRLKIGSCSGDVVARIAAQVGTGTPDKPVMLLRIKTHDCRALERTLHGMLRLKGRQIAGAGAEWFLATRDELVAAYERVVT
jgi:T5orf172 domain